MPGGETIVRVRSGPPPRAAAAAISWHDRIAQAGAVRLHTTGRPGDERIAPLVVGVDNTRA